MNVSTLIALPDSALTATLLLATGILLTTVVMISQSVDRKDRKLLPTVLEGLKRNAWRLTAVTVITLLIAAVSSITQPVLTVPATDPDSTWAHTIGHSQAVLHGAVIFWFIGNHVLNLTDRCLLGSRLADSPHRIDQHIGAGRRHNLVGNILVLVLFLVALQIMHHGIGWAGTVYLFVVHGVFQYHLFQRVYPDPAP